MMTVDILVAHPATKEWLIAHTGLPWRDALALAKDLEARGLLVHIEPLGA
jgi:hypothetical protein